MRRDFAVVWSSLGGVVCNGCRGLRTGVMGGCMGPKYFLIFFPNSPRVWSVERDEGPPQNRESSVKKLEESI